MPFETISPASLPTLSHLSTLLHLFHHRNHNQHRRSTWYRHFSLFRKQLTHLLTSLHTLHTTIPTTHHARILKKAQDPLTRQHISGRLDFWRDVMVAKWQHAFSQIVAEGRFAVLGLVLLAVLAEVCEVVGLTGEVVELGQGEVEKVLEEFGREWAGVGGGEEDVGEVVVRREGEVLGVEKGEVNPGVKRRLEAPTGKVAKKKRKTGNAIDDIFG